MPLFKKKEYIRDEIKLHIKRLEKEVKELQKQYNTTLLRSKEMFSKPHSIKDVMECFNKYGNPKDLNCTINSCKESIIIYKNMINSTL